jgi:hypothetical protein
MAGNEKTGQERDTGKEPVRFVVARYREDLAWLEGIPWPATVYDKGGDLPASESPWRTVRSLSNLGREAHTYLTHIIRDWEHLAEATVFVQGNPFFHLRSDGEATVADLVALVEERVASAAPFSGLAWFRMRCDGLGRPHDMRAPSTKGRWAGWGKDIPVAEVFEGLFAAPAPGTFIARGATGNFLVSRERIHARPRSFYERMLRMIADDPDDERNTGHAVERLWQHVFGGNPALGAEGAGTPGHAPREGEEA